jgi:nitrite reductase/ring-hydroxylating ferredoxin subunit
MVKLAESPHISAVEICGVDQLWDGEMESFSARNTTILLLKINGQFHAYQGKCPHQGATLAEGELDGALLTCPAHRWQFDATTGQGVNPKSARLKGFPVHVVGRKVVIDVELGGVNVESESLSDTLTNGGDHEGE